MTRLSRIQKRTHKELVELVCFVKRQTIISPYLSAEDAVDTINFLYKFFVSRVLIIFGCCATYIKEAAKPHNAAPSVVSKRTSIDNPISAIGTEKTERQSLAAEGLL
jgi:hypothetical protein